MKAREGFIWLYNNVWGDYMALVGIVLFLAIVILN